MKNEELMKLKYELSEWADLAVERERKSGYILRRIWSLCRQVQEEQDNDLRKLQKITTAVMKALESNQIPNEIADELWEAL
jgi:hypothetical protein